MLGSGLRERRILARKESKLLKLKAALLKALVALLLSSVSKSVGHRSEKCSIPSTAERSTSLSRHDEPTVVFWRLLRMLSSRISKAVIHFHDDVFYLAAIGEGTWGNFGSFQPFAADGYQRKRFLPAFSLNSEAVIGDLVHLCAAEHAGLHAYAFLFLFYPNFYYRASQNGQQQTTRKQSR